MPDTFNTEPDVVLIGAGIMSATLGVLLKELEPSLNIEMFETLEGAGLESSDSWNSAGTGHAANCELNYTPERATAVSTYQKRPRSTSNSTCRANSGLTFGDAGPVLSRCEERRLEAAGRRATRRDHQARHQTRRYAGVGN